MWFKFIKYFLIEFSSHFYANYICIYIYIFIFLNWFRLKNLQIMLDVKGCCIWSSIRVFFQSSNNKEFRESFDVCHICISRIFIYVHAYIVLSTQIKMVICKYKFIWIHRYFIQFEKLIRQYKYSWIH